MTHLQKRVALLLALGFALLPLCAGSANDKKSSDKNEFYKGKVVPLAELLAKSGAKLDADAGPFSLVLQADDGKLYPLVKDDGSRMFFKDAKLLKRPMRLTARKVANSDFLQVINVHSIVKGKLHEVYYWCDICSIKRYEAGACDCCGAPLDLHEDPLKPD